jgi:hypothetical protein
LYVLLVRAVGLEQQVGAEGELHAILLRPPGDPVPVARGLGFRHLLVRQRVVSGLERLKAQPCALLADEPQCGLVGHVPMLDGPDAGVERPPYARNRVNVGGHIGAPVARRLHGSPDLVRRVLQHLNRIGLGDDAASDRELDLACPFLELVPHRRQHLGNAIGDRKRADLLETRRTTPDGGWTCIRGETSPWPAVCEISAPLGKTRGPGITPASIAAFKPKVGPPVSRIVVNPRVSVRSASATALAYMRPVSAASMLAIVLGANTMCQWASLSPGISTRPRPSITVLLGGPVIAPEEISLILLSAIRTFPGFN